MKRISFLILLPFFVRSPAAEAVEWSWKSFTSMNIVTDMCGQSGALWCGTEGGLLSFDTDTESFTTWTNTEGLTANDVTAVAGDADGRVWIGMRNGWLQRYDPSGGESWFVDDFEAHAITCLVCSSDTLFVGTDIGVSMYLIDRREVKETYRRLGGFHSDIPVVDLHLFENALWVATEEGIAAASLDAVNLLDPQSWTNFTAADGLPDHAVTSIHSFRGTLYAGTGQGVAVFGQDGFQAMNEGLPSLEVRDLTGFSDALHALCATGVASWDGQAWTRVGPAFFHGTVSVAHLSRLWIGTEEGVLLYDPSDDSWASYAPDTPPGNRFIDLAHADGVLWCCSSATTGKGFFSYDGNSWTSYRKAVYPELPSDEAISVAVDAEQRVWIGTHGGGIIQRRPDGSFRLYNSENGYLAGIPGFPSYAVVWDMLFDRLGTLWILNRDALTRTPLISVVGDAWTYYGTADGIATGSLKILASDAEDRIWIGSHWESSQGVFILDPAGTPGDRSDDPPLERLNTSDGLESNEITALAPDRTGGMWIGTPRGLHYYFGGHVTRRYGLPSENITALAVDGADNLWAGTSEGLSFFSSLAYTWQHFTTETSDLVSNDILSLCFDVASGTLYIGTNHGLSVLDTPYSESTEELVPLALYPNPFLPEDHGQIFIDNLARGVSAAIYTASGFLVRRFPPEEIQGRRLSWDGRDDSGRFAAGGVYVVVTTSENGRSIIEKFALVR